jgi:PAS domain S-box-containing protein
MKNVLIVEDESLTAWEIQEKLQQNGYDVTEIVGAGRDAISSAAKNQPDLVLMDIMLDDDMDGIQAAEEIREKYDIPVIYLTAYSDDPTLERAVKTQPYGYIHKPFEDRELITNIEIALYNHSQSRSVRQSEKKYREIIENVNDIIYSLDPNDTFEYVNPTTEKFCGYEKEEVIGKKFYQFVYHDDMPKIIRLIKDARTGADSSEEYRMLTKSGRIKWVQSSSQAVYTDEKYMGIKGVIRDITDQKLTHEATRYTQRLYNNLIDKSGIGVVINDSDGNFKYFNKNFAKLFGYSPQELEQISIFSIIHPEDADYVIDTINQLSELNESKKYAFRGIKRNGDIVYLEASTVTVVRNNMIISSWSYIWDVSHYEYERREMAELLEEVNISRETIEEKTHELMLMNRELDASREKLEAGVREKDSFLSVIAHDLKNPLGSFVPLLEHIFENFEIIEKDELKNIIETLYESSRHLYGLLENLLEWSLIRTGRKEYFFAPTDLGEVIDKVLSLFKISAANKGIRFERDIPVGCLVYADDHVLMTVLRNLVSNALKFSHGGGQVKISVEETQQHYLVSVIDEGVGISRISRRKIFRDGNTYTTPGTSNEKGTGLGLLLCRECIRKLGGEIEISSEPGKGSVFSFPLQKLPDA